MDLSKLPRLSKTDTPAPAETPAVQPAAQQVARAAAPSPGTILCPACASPLRGDARFCDKCGAQLQTPGAAGRFGFGAEAWFSIGIGILLLFFFPTLVQYASSRIFHTRFAPYADFEGQPSDSVHITITDADGQSHREIRPYRQTRPDSSPNFLNDAAITSFALALILEGIALVLFRKPAVVVLALILTVAATLINLAYVIGTYGKYGLAYISAIAVIFGGYMALYQLALFQSMRRASPATK